MPTAASTETAVLSEIDNLMVWSENKEIGDKLVKGQVYNLYCFCCGFVQPAYRFAGALRQISTQPVRRTLHTATVAKFLIGKITSCIGQVECPKT